MPFCIALVPSRAHPNAWLRCRQKAGRGERLCRQHRDAADGIVMGYLALEITHHAKLLHEIATNGARARASEFIERTWIDIAAANRAGARESARSEIGREGKCGKGEEITRAQEWLEERRRHAEVSPAAPSQLQPAD